MNFLGVLFLFTGIVIISFALILCLTNFKKNRKISTKVMIAISIFGISSTVGGIKLLINDLNSQKSIATSIENNSSKIEETNNKTKDEQTNITDVITMEVEINQNENYVLPSHLQNVTSNGNIKEITVVWDPSQLDTSKIGEYIFTGIAPELSKHVKLTLKVTADNTVPQNNFFIQNKTYGIVNNNTLYYIGEKSIKYYNNQLQNKPKSISFAWSKGFCIIGNKIYYIEDGRKLFKINFDGTDKTKISSDEIHDFVVDENYIYFISYNDSKLYKMNIDGTNKELVSNDTPHLMVINKGWIYYINTSDNAKLYKIKVDGTGRTKLTETAIHSIDVADDFIYYIVKSNNNGIYKIKTDGTMNTKISNEKAYFIKTYKGSIYFTENNSGPNSIHKLNIDGTALKKLPLTDIFSFTIFDDTIFSIHNSGKTEMYISDLDGNNLTRLPM